MLLFVVCDQMHLYCILSLILNGLLIIIIFCSSLSLFLAQAASQAAADITAMSTLSPTKGGTNHRPKKKAFDAQKIYAAAMEDLSGSSIQFRVRGSQEGIYLH